MRTSADLKNILQSVKSSRNIAILGATKGSGVSSITNFLYKNFGFKPDGDLKIQELELGRISLSLEDNSLINIDNTNKYFCDKEGVIIVIDVSQKIIDSASFIDTLRTIQKYRLNIVWYFNKVDKAIFEMEKNNPEEIYQVLVERIDQVNQFIEQANDDQSDYIEEVEPSKGNVFFGSAVDGWAFSLANFAQEYSIKLKIEPQKLVTKLWGENFYNLNEKTWHTTLDESNKAHRSFCTFIFDPIWRLHLLIRQGSLGPVEELVKSLGINVDISNKSGRVLLRVIMYAWLNSAKALVGGVQQFILSFEEGILGQNRWQVYSKQLEKYHDLNANILYSLGKDSLTGLVLVKVLKKLKGDCKLQQLNSFESDLSNGSQLKTQVEITGIYHPFYSSNNIEIEWTQALEGSVLLLKASNASEGQILTDLKEIPFYKTYDQYAKGIPSSVDNKNPFSVSNYILGTIDKVNPKVKQILTQRNELFLSVEEMTETLMKKFEFTKQDVTSIVTIKGDSIVQNYSKSNQNKNLAVCFEQALSQSNIKGVRVEIESINDKAALNDEELIKALVNEFKTYIS